MSLLQSSVLAACAVILCLDNALAASADLVIQHVNVIPMTHETVLPDQTVVVRDGKIEAIAPSNETKSPRRAEVIDGTGKYLMPGLCDLHVHFNGGSQSNPDMLALYLANGVTTILNMRGSRGILELRDQVISGEILGPTIYTTSPIIGNISPDPKTYEDGQAMVERFQKEGYDFIKVYNFIPAEGYRGVMEAANRLGMPVVGHTVRSVGIEGALSSGQHMAHMEEVVYGCFGEDGKGLDESGIPAVAERFKDAHLSVIATLVVFHNIVRQVDDLDAMLHSPGMEYLHPRITRSWHAETNEYTTRFDQESVGTFLAPMFAFQQKLVKRFVDTGVPILLGTDTSIAIVVPGYSAHDELREFVDAGLTPYQALQAGTSKATAFLGHNAGTIEAGKRADLVLLGANPLENIENSRSIDGVVIGGTWLPREALQERLDRIRASIEAEQ